MDFHALPRRDLQALCKRNGVRANMTNVAMADALAALPAVDGIEEYVKQPIAAEPVPAAKPAVKAVVEEEKQQGNAPPRGRRVASKPDPTTREDGAKDEEDLKRDENKDDAPALGMGRRGAGRRAPAAEAVVVAPAIRRRRAAASKTGAGDVAAEAVPAPTTRPRSQRTAALVGDEEVPRAGRTARRATTRKTGVQQEEEGEGPKGVASDVEITLPAPASDDGADDSQGVEEEQNEAVEKLIQEGEEAVMASSTSVEDEPPVAEDCTAHSLVQEQQIDILQCEGSPILMGEATEEVGFTGDAGRAIEEDNEVPTTSIEVLDCGAKSDEAGAEDCYVYEEKEDLAVDEVHAVVAAEEEEVVDTNKTPQSSATMAEGVEEVVTVDNVSQVTVTDDEGAVKESAFTGDVKDCSDHVEEDSEVPMICVAVLNGAVKADEAGTEDCSLSEEKEDLPVDEVLHDTVVAVEEEGAVANDSVPQSSATMDEDVEKMVTVDNVSQVTVTDDEGAVKKSAFTGDVKDCSDHIEEDSEVPMTCVEVLNGAVKANEAGTEDCSLSEEKEDLPVHEVLHDTVVVVEEEGAVANDSVPQSSATMDEDVEKMVTVDNVSQVTVTDEDAGKESASTDELSPVFEVAGGCNGHITSPLSARMLDDATNCHSTNCITVEPAVFETDDLPLCMYNNSGAEENVTEPVALEQEKEVNDNNKSEALGNLSLRKLRVKFKETVAVGQENQVKEGKKSMPLEKLSLRKLRVKLRETLNAHKSREPNRVALARLDENVC